MPWSVFYVVESCNFGEVDTLSLIIFVICVSFRVSMKIKFCLVASAALVVASCSSTDDAPARNRASVVVKPQPAGPAKYLALPGQAAVAVAGVDDAFDTHVAQYGAQTQTTADMGSAVGQAAAGSLAPLQQTTSPVLPADSTAPTYIHQTAVPGQAVIGALSDSSSSIQPGLVSSTGMSSVNGMPINYSVRITNSTPGKIFVEAQDAAGTIYPCGFMDGGRSATTPLEKADPIVGPITIVVRDPDKDGAPEIRRFKVNPPSFYVGKTVGISIIPGGKYHASVDGNVYASGEAVAPPPVAVPSMTASTPMPVAGGVMNYTVKITNTTPGKILVEARDAAGVEFPCGEMVGGESKSTPREQAAPIKGPITVIVRDPDKEGFPEIRRYKVNPPANYAGKTLGISIVPGGQYHASLDGQVYYTYTPPEAPITTNPVPQPVAPVAPAATPAPAAAPAGI